MAKGGRRAVAKPANCCHQSPLTRLVAVAGIVAAVAILLILLIFGAVRKYENQGAEEEFRAAAGLLASRTWSDNDSQLRSVRSLAARVARR
jgi:hypothetical protein